LDSICNLDFCFAMSSEGALRSGSAIAAAQSTTSMLTRNTAPKPAPLATKSRAGLASPKK
jgi:hypothetical protein